MGNFEKKKLSIITSWDDGSAYDFKLAALLQQYNLPGIFFCHNNCEIGAKGIVKLAKAGFVIGGHTVNHPEDLKLLPPDRQWDEVKQNKVWLEELIKEPVNWFAYPGGRGGEITRGIVYKAHFTYARRTNIGEIKAPEAGSMDVQTSVHVKMHRKENFNWLPFAYEMATKAATEGGVFHLWGHSWEIEKEDQWKKLEKLFRFLNLFDLKPHESILPTNR